MADKKKATSRSQMAEPRTREKAPVAKATVREERKEQPKKEPAKKETPRKEQPRQENKRRDTRNSSPNAFQRLRNSRVGRFLAEAYYELRHKVTWPTFIEARNMTFVVIVLSVVVGCLLGLVDYGLYSLFLAIGR
jgi:preprotein translocase SecE subunit